MENCENLFLPQSITEEIVAGRIKQLSSFKATAQSFNDHGSFRCGAERLRAL
jgi:hypothetical protein